MDIEIAKIRSISLLNEKTLLQTGPSGRDR